MLGKVSFWKVWKRQISGCPSFVTWGSGGGCLISREAIKTVQGDWSALREIHINGVITY